MKVPTMQLPGRQESEGAGLYDFVGFGELAETTTQLLSLNLHQTAHSGDKRSDMDSVGQLVLQQAGDYLGKVREGFVLSVRAGQIGHQAELRFLLDRVISDWSQLSREMGLAEDGEDREPVSSPCSSAQGSGETTPLEIERVRQQLLAFGMAVVALGHLPRLPSKQVTFPHSYGNPPTYSDIPVPNTPGEMLWRIEELEQMVRRLMSDDLHGLVQRRYGSLRRTYGFFEASAWLTHKERVRFGVKKRTSSFLVL
jgi:hypothetical protein